MPQVRLIDDDLALLPRISQCASRPTREMSTRTPPEERVENNQAVFQGIIFIDVFDSSTGVELWQGNAVANVARGQSTRSSWRVGSTR